MHVAILLWQIVFDGPAMNLVGTPIGSAVPVRATPIPLLQELLVVALQLVVEDDAADDRASLSEPLGLPFVGAVDLRVVG